MKGGGKSTCSKLGRYMKAPIRILRRARDLYVKSLTDCSGKMHYGAVMGCPTGPVYTLPRSYSVSSSRSNQDEDLRELIRVVSQRRINEEKGLMQMSKASKGLPKSFSVGIGRIDEDKACEFSEDFKVDLDKVLGPRSRSYAVSKKRNIGVLSLE